MILGINFKKTIEDAKQPEKAHESDACFDLFTVTSGLLYPGERAVFDTGIAFQIREGWMGEIKERSGLAVRNGLQVIGGIIDANFCEAVRIILHNSDKSQAFEVKKGMKIAQIGFHKVPQIVLTEVTDFPKVGRGDNGFGSSGV